MDQRSVQLLDWVILNVIKSVSIINVFLIVEIVKKRLVILDVSRNKLEMDNAIIDVTKVKIVNMILMIVKIYHLIFKRQQMNFVMKTVIDISFKTINVILNAPLLIVSLI